MRFLLSPAVKRLFLLGWVCTAGAGVPLSAIAQPMTSKDIKVFSGILNYVRGLEKEGTSLILGIAYDPAQPQSLESAQATLAQLNESKHTKKSGLTAQLIPMTENGLQLDGGMIDIIYITHDMDRYYENLLDFAKKNHVFTFSTDKDCVQNNCCIVSVQTESGIDIFLNEGILRETGFEVDAAFKFMVKRV